MSAATRKETKSELFRDLLPLLNSGRIVLPRFDRLRGQIVGLERRTSAVGRDTISHLDRGHDDVANAVAGAAALSKFGGYDTSIAGWVTITTPPGSASVFKPSSTAGGASDYDGVSARSLTLKAPAGILQRYLAHKSLPENSGDRHT